MTSAQEIIAVQKLLESDRGTWENHWTEVARYVLQRQDDFYQVRQQGEKRTEYMFDSVAPMALEKCTAAIENTVTPRGLQWHTLTSMYDEFKDDREVKIYYEDLAKLLFKVRYSGDGNFASQWFETLMSMCAFGTGVMLVDDIPGKGIKYKSSHLGEHYICENAWGDIDTDYRKFKMRGRQALSFYEGHLSEDLTKKFEQQKDDWHWFIHCVKPNENYKPGSNNPQRMKYGSFHVHMDSGTMIKTGGYRTFPFVIIRYVTAPNETYGRGPAMLALPEIKMVNKMRKTDIRARNLAVQPPILTANENSVRRVNLKENAINFGALDANGNQLIKPWDSGVRIDLSNDSINQSHEIINDAFLVKLFQLLVETPQMTATEVLQRAQDKAALLAPTMGRIQSEGLSKLILRELDILSMAGELPEPPEQLRDRPFAYDVEYTSPISRMQKSDEALAVQRTIDALIPVAQIDPVVLEPINWKEYGRIVGEANNAPARLYLTEEQVEARAQQKQQDQQLTMLTEAAPQFAGAVKDLAQAQSYAQ